MFKFISRAGMVLLIIGMSSLWIGVAAIHHFVQPLMPLVIAEPDYIGNIAVFNILFILAVPIIVLVMFLLRNLINTDLRKGIIAGFAVLWLANGFSLAGIVAHGVKDWSATSQTEKTNSLNLKPGEVLTIKELPNAYDEDVLSIDHIHYSHDTREVFVDGTKSLKITPEDKPTLKTIISSYGRTMDDAKKNAQNIDYKVRIENNKIFLPKNYGLGDKGKLRHQRISFDLRVPVGTEMKLSKKVLEILDHDNSLMSSSIDPRKTLIMSSKGLIEKT